MASLARTRERSRATKPAPMERPTQRSRWSSIDLVPMPSMSCCQKMNRAPDRLDAVSRRRCESSGVFPESTTVGRKAWTRSLTRPPYCHSCAIRLRGAYFSNRSSRAIASIESVGGSSGAGASAPLPSRLIRAHSRGSQRRAMEVQHIVPAARQLTAQLHLEGMARIVVDHDSHYRTPPSMLENRRPTLRLRAGAARAHRLSRARQRTRRE